MEHVGGRVALLLEFQHLPRPHPVFCLYLLFFLHTNQAVLTRGLRSFGPETHPPQTECLTHFGGKFKFD